MDEYYDFLLENDPEFLAGTTKEDFLNTFQSTKDVEDYYDFIAETKPGLIKGVEKQEFVEYRLQALQNFSFILVYLSIYCLLCQAGQHTIR